MIRRLARDRRNLVLDPRAELALYCGREAQVLAEEVRPALARGETVLLDRSLLTPIVLGAWGRGLPVDDCEAMAAIAANGLEPDLTIVLDVHPRTSRIRKRLAKAREVQPSDPGRKGLAGSALKERVWQGYREVAHERGFPILHTERILPADLARRVMSVIQDGALPKALERPGDAIPYWMADADAAFLPSLEGVPLDLALFLTRGLRCGRSLRERGLEQVPELVAWALDPEDPLRSRLAETHPERALSGWMKRPLDEVDLRMRLASQAPRAVAHALRHSSGEVADGLRNRLLSDAPGEVVESLAGREDDRALRMRAAGWSEADLAQRSTSLTGCTDVESWRLREKLIAKDPVMGIRSLRGVAGPRALALCRTYAAYAPKTVLRAIGGQGAAEVHALRNELTDTGREVLDSLGALVDDEAWAMRESLASRWPSSVLGSVLGVFHHPRLARLTARCREMGAGDLHVSRRVQGLDERAGLPDWYRPVLQAGLDDEE